ncbi:MAG: ABC transporter permease [Paenibacillus sp. RIFOXYA1_FULL_44_5]|nr:MAG: ABC transporter permease [Paenibacillus sp. RIFOXYA1_FULL_44_5]
MTTSSKPTFSAGAVFGWVLGLILLWELAAWAMQNLFHVNSAKLKLPYLHDVLYTMLTNIPVLLDSGTKTFGNALTGLLLGSLIGAALAFAMNRAKSLESTIAPYLIFSQMVPIIGLAPIVFGIIHDAQYSRIIMAAYVTFFPVAINTLKGLKSIRKEHLELMFSYAPSRWQLFSKLQFTASLPDLFIGLKLAAPLAITSAIVVELMGAPDGIGVIMVTSLYYGTASAYMFWSTVFTSIGIGVLLFSIISLLERLVTPWQPEFRKKGG